MIHEFAVEPELIFEWAESRRDVAYFSDAFGLGHPRILAKYPNDWTERATQHAETSCQQLMAAAHSGEEEGRIQMRKARFDALMNRLVHNNIMLERDCLEFSHERDWVENASTHAPDPFYAILARRSTKRSKHVLVGDNILESSRWKLNHSQLIARDPSTIITTVKPILQRCRFVTFIDQFFHPGSNAHIDLLRNYLQILSATPRYTPPRIEVWCAEEKKGKPWTSTVTDFKNLNLEAELDVGWSVRIICYRQSGHEQIHNRYILTDIGGVVFAAGLGSGRRGSHDDIAVMERQQYEVRIAQYSVPTKAFYLDPAEAITIHGTRSPEKR